MKNIKNKFIPLLISIFAAVTLGLSGCMDLFDKEDVPTSFTITFNGNGGKTADDATTYTQNYAYGETKALLPNAFSKDGKTFAGWGTNTETSSYTDKAQASFSSDTTLYAIWTDKVGLTVTYVDGCSETITVPSEQEYTAGATVEVNFTDIGERDGYTFTGWNDGQNDYTETGTTTFTMPDHNVTLTAQWTGNTIKDGGITTKITMITEVIIIDRDSLPDDPVAMGLHVPFTGAVGYDKYYWYCDDTLLATTTTNSFSWDTKSASPGENCITVLATKEGSDAAFSDTVYVIVYNPIPVEED